MPDFAYARPIRELRSGPQWNLEGGIVSKLGPRLTYNALVLSVMEVPAPRIVESAPSPGMITLTHVLSGMHGFSALMGLLGTAFIVPAFLTGWPAIIAVIINYVKRGETRGTWLDSHFGWQIRTFWYAVWWVCGAARLFVTVI